MKKEIEEGQQKLIDHLQQKLADLRMQRNQLQKQKYSTQSYEKSSRPPIPNGIRASPVQKLELENNLQKLQKLYQAKKQLRQAGIETNDPAQIFNYKQDPKWANYVERKKKKVAQNAQKMKIINQQMIKTKQFLRSKRVADKQLSELQEMNYRNILKQKIEQLKKYVDLVNKSSLSRVQKQDLITSTFNLLKQGSNKARKDIIKIFLLANPQFCKCFYITHAEINRDLQVFQTKEQGCLDERQFFQFIKSIQITNPSINPASKRMSGNKKRQNSSKKILLQKEININSKEKQQIKLNERQKFRKVLDYFRKVFKNFDRSNQSIVERAKYVAALQKGMYLDPNKDKHIELATLKQFAKYMIVKTKQYTSKRYYKQLESKYINFVQIETFFKQYSASKQPKQEQVSYSQQSSEYGHTTDQNHGEHQQQNYGIINQQNQSQLSSQINLSSKQGKILTEKDFQRYGWSNGQNKVDNQITIQQLDKYYEQIGQKYANQIHWNGYGQQYKADFKQLQAFIKLQDQKEKKST